MSAPPNGDTPEHRSATRASVVAGLIVAAVGAFVLCGWIWDVESLKTIYGPITMKTNTAIGLLLCGWSLAVLRRWPRWSAYCGAAAALIGGLTFSEHLIGWDLGIDQFLFTEAPGAAGTASPNRMGLNAATTFVLAGLALWHLARGTRGAPIAQRLAVAALILAAIPLAGYLYGAEQLYRSAQYTGIALHTALAFTVLHTGILLARANVGPVSVFLGDGPAATMLRSLALPVLLLPPGIGYLEILARNSDIVDRGLGIALYAVSLIVVLGVVVWHTAQVIERSDHARRRAERDRDALIASEQQSRAEAERANRLKDQFLATLSHELRTPLNVMLGWTRILEQGAGDDHARIAGLVAKNGRLLARLVEDLLDLSRVAAGQFEISRAPTPLNAVVQSALDAIVPTASARGIALVSEMDPAMEPIEADAERLQQIVWNLLANAVKFTPAGGSIVVRTSIASESVTLMVRDTGVGFDAAFESELFKPFRQADSSASREHGGLGLGLSIARHIAQLHGGSLTGSSPGLGQGATFTLTLPRSAQPAALAQQTLGRQDASSTLLIGNT